MYGCRCGSSKAITLIEILFYKILRDEIGHSGVILVSEHSPGDTTMKRKPAQRRSRVTAVFNDARLSFEIGRDVTLAQLAERLSILGEVHGGLPLSVDVRVAIERSH